MGRNYNKKRIKGRIMTYRIFYWMMVSGYFYIAIYTPSLRMKIIGILLTLVNAILFWR